MGGGFGGAGPKKALAAAKPTAGVSATGQEIGIRQLIELILE